jgi:putative ATP-dependent endonuclease of OLD family
LGFNRKNIPLIKINGKGSVQRYRNFFNYFEIDVHAILDLDVLVDGFNKIGASEHINSIYSQLIDEIDKIADFKKINGVPENGDKIRKMTEKYSWQQRYQRLKDLCGTLISGNTLSDDEILEISLLFEIEKKNKRKQVLQSRESEISYKDILLSSLRDEKIYVLSRGTLEDYYPPWVYAEDKISKAIIACELLPNRESVLKIFSLENSHQKEDQNDEEQLDKKTEFEVIFEKIFETIHLPLNELNMSIMGISTESQTSAYQSQLSSTASQPAFPDK